MAVKYPKVRSFHGILSLLRDPFSQHGYYRQIGLSTRSNLELADRTPTCSGNLLLNYRSSSLMLWYKNNPQLVLFSFNYASFTGAKNLVNKFLPDGFKVVIEQGKQYLVHTVDKKRLKYLFNEQLALNDYRVVVNYYTGETERPE